MSEYIKFLAKGGGATGIGHVMRSLNVARALKEMDMPVYFLFDGENSATGMLRRMVSAGAGTRQAGRHLPRARPGSW